MTPFGVFWRKKISRSVQPPGENPPEIPPPSPGAKKGEIRGFGVFFTVLGGPPPGGSKRDILGPEMGDLA